MTEPNVCGAQHPNVESVTCELAPGFNAYNEDVPGDDPNVHVHKGSERDEDETVTNVHRWEG